MTTVLVLPGGTKADRALLTDTIERAGHLGVLVASDPGPAGRSPTRVCAAILAMAPAPPLIIAAAGDAALLVPAVARAQRAAHRQVVEYLLVEPTMPTVTDSWPDAPVTVVTGQADGGPAGLARLRGWVVLAASDPWRPWRDG